MLTIFNVLGGLALGVAMCIIYRYGRGESAKAYVVVRTRQTDRNNGERRFYT